MTPPGTGSSTSGMTQGNADHHGTDQRVTTAERGGKQATGQERPKGPGLLMLRPRRFLGSFPEPRRSTDTAPSQYQLVMVKGRDTGKAPAALRHDRSSDQNNPPDKGAPQPAVSWGWFKRSPSVRGLMQSAGSLRPGLLNWLRKCGRSARRSKQS